MYQNNRHLLSKYISLSKRTVCSLTARKHDGDYQLRRTFSRYTSGYCYTCLPDTNHKIFNFSNDYQMFSFSTYFTPRNSIFSLKHSDDHFLFLYLSIYPMLDIFSWQSWIKSKFVCLIDYVGIIIRCPSLILLLSLKVGLRRAQWTLASV